MRVPTSTVVIALLALVAGASAQHLEAHAPAAALVARQEANATASTVANATSTANVGSSSASGSAGGGGDATVDSNCSMTNKLSVNQQARYVSMLLCRLCALPCTRFWLTLLYPTLLLASLVFYSLRSAGAAEWSTRAARQPRDPHATSVSSHRSLPRWRVRFPTATTWPRTTLRAWLVSSR